MWHLQRIPKRIYRLIDAEGKELGRLEYPSSWSMRGEILVADGMYQVRSKGVFRSRMVVTMHDRTVAEMEMGWRAVTITFPDRPGEQLGLRKRSFWKSEYQLHDRHGKVLATFRSKITIGSMYPDLELTGDLDPGPNAFHVLLAVHGMVARHRQTVSAAVMT